MAQHEFLAGSNFSGRSAHLTAMLRAQGMPSFFIGPYAEAALSGLSVTVADEIALYRGKPSTPARRAFVDVTDPQRRPQSLSGGEQVLLALHCFSLSSFARLAIDTALEQLDGDNRAAAIDYLAGGDFAATVIDNRLAAPAGWQLTPLAATTPAFACAWQPLLDSIPAVEAPDLTIRDLSFAYVRGTPIFRGVNLALAPGGAYRLHGRNGAGKTTLLKILVGVLAPDTGRVALGGAEYRPWREGNRALALAMQNPDHQWCGATLREDLARRQAALARRAGVAEISGERVARLARWLGVASLDTHLYELPLAARKRVSWLWPFFGAHPWIMFDEPTIGQDAETRVQLAAAIARFCAAGYGVIFVSHDDDFAARVPHRRLALADRTVTLS